VTGHIVTHPPGRWHLTTSVAPPWFRLTPPFQRQGPVSCALEFASWSGSSSTYSNRYVFMLKRLSASGSCRGRKESYERGIGGVSRVRPRQGPPLEAAEDLLPLQMLGRGSGHGAGAGGMLGRGESLSFERGRTSQPQTPPQKKDW